MFRINPHLRALVWLLLVMATAHVCALAQTPAQPQPATPVQDSPPAAQAAQSNPDIKLLPPPSKHDVKLAAEHFRRGRKLFDKGDLQRAEGEYTEAARLFPGNATYVAERELTRAKLVNQLVQKASEARRSGNHRAADDALGEAHEIDPTNSSVEEQVRAEATEVEPAVLPTGALQHIEFGAIVLQPGKTKQAIHFRGGGQELVKQTFQRYGITATVDSSVPNQTAKIDTEDLDFEHAIQIVLMQTGTFYVPLDPHRVLVAKDNTENRTRFERQYVETIYMPGLTQTELQDASNVVKQILLAKQITTNTAEGTLTIRAPQNTLEVANNLLTDLYEGHSQVLLKLTLYQVSRTNERVVGIQLPSQLSIYNLPAELASLYAMYATQIQQLIASGLVSANNPLEILAALIASGELTNSPLTQGFVKVGGGLTEFVGEIGSGGTGNVSLNSSYTRQLDQVQMRVGNLETATFRSGTRYPIISSSYSSLGVSAAALGTAGTNIMQLLNQAGISSSSLTTTTTTPNVQYQDLGLTIKATPTIQQSGDVSMKLEMKISALAGSALNNVPILTNQDFETTIGVKEGEASIITSDLSRQEAKSLTGIPGLNDIPGFPATNVDRTLDTSELVLVLEPHVVRFDHPNGHGKMILLPLH